MTPGLWSVRLTFALVVPDAVAAELAPRVESLSVDPAGLTVVCVHVPAWTATAAVAEADAAICSVFRFAGQPEPWGSLTVAVEAEQLAHRYRRSTTPGQ